MNLLSNILENINCKYEKLLKKINTVFNSLWCCIYLLYFISSFYVLEFQLSYIFNFLQILLGFIIIFNFMNTIYFLLNKFTKYELKFLYPLNLLVKILAFFNLILILYISIFKYDFIFYNHFLTLVNYSYVIFLSLELFFVLYSINKKLFQIKVEELPKSNDIDNWFDDEYYGYSLQLKEFLNVDFKEYIETNHEKLKYLEDFIFSKFPTEEDLVRENFLLEKNINVNINSFEFLQKALSKGAKVAIAFVIKTGLISTILISSFISAFFAGIRLILSTIASKITIFIGKNNITKSEDLKTYVIVGMIVFLFMIIILAFQNITQIIKNIIKHKRNKKYKDNYLKLIRYIAKNYDCLKNRGN